MATADQILAAALDHHRAGRLVPAEQLYRQLLTVNPRHADAWHLLAIIHQGRRDFPAALAHFQKALDIDPRQAHFHSNLGNLHRELGQASAAEECYRRALSIQPGFAEAHNNLGCVLKDGGRLAEAAESFRRALHLQPTYGEAATNLSQVLCEQKQPAEALAWSMRALAHRPDSAAAHEARGNALRALGRLEEGEAALRHALRLAPHDANILVNLGDLLHERRRERDAVDLFRRALELRPDFPEAHNNLGCTLLDLGATDEASASFRRALELRPGFAAACNNLGSAYADRGEADEAAACYERARALDPELADANLNSSLAHLAQGDYARGWPAYEWRRRVKNYCVKTYPEPAWDGGPLAGKTILLYAEQGLGDTIQFARFVLEVKKRGGYVILAAQRPLLPLLVDLPGVDSFVPDDGPLPAYDVQAPLMSLPGLLGTTLDTIPPPIPCHVSPAALASWREQLAKLPGLRVGIAWQGSPWHKKDWNRSAPLAVFERLAGVAGLTLVSLQAGKGVEQLAELGGRFPIVDLRIEARSDFAETAAAVRNLDAVVCVDTALAHLAGSLGVSTYVALSISHDWRWLRDRADSPWYPSVQVFRQRRRGDWPEVFERIAEALPRLGG